MVYTKRVCVVEGCAKASRIPYDVCARHGGRTKCKRCTRIARVGGLCKPHCIGKLPERCKYNMCKREARTKTGFCATHGSGKSCVVKGCNRNARVKGLCATHGLKRRCIVEGCDYVARARQYCGKHRFCDMKLLSELAFYDEE